MRYYVNDNTYSTFFLQLDELNSRVGAIASLKPTHISDLCVQLNALVSLYYVLLQEYRNNYYSTEDHINIKKQKNLKDAYKGLQNILHILRAYYTIEYGVYDVETAVRFLVARYMGYTGSSLSETLKANMIDVSEFVMNEIRREIQIDFTSAAFPQSGIFKLKMKIRNVLKNILNIYLKENEDGSITIIKPSASENVARVTTSQSESG
nr:p23 RNA silencing suppressor [Fig virus B]